MSVYEFVVQASAPHALYHLHPATASFTCPATPLLLQSPAYLTLGELKDSSLPLLCYSRRFLQLLLRFPCCFLRHPAESRTPPLTLGELKGSNLAGAPAGADAATGQATPDSGPVGKPRQPVIFSPKEPAGGGSLGEGSVGVAAGDPAGGANIVAAARTAGKGIMVSERQAAEHVHLMMSCACLYSLASRC
jgi:hypothetical protein